MRFFVGFVFLLFASFLSAQQTIERVGQLPYSDLLNDIWGYVAPDGTEYALVGLRHGVSIVSLEDPSQPEEVVHLEGPYSVWRDLKTFEQYAYVVLDQPNTREGLIIIDLSPLPDTAYVSYYQPFVAEENDSLRRCHNIYIDEKGVCYLAGCNLNNGGVIALDLLPDPAQPQFIGPIETDYSHDVFARDDLAYSANIYLGGFSMIDVSDKNAPELIGFSPTPFQFCHNVWLSDDGNTLFTTDEKRAAPVASYDVSDPSDIRYLDEFRPLATLDRGTIPHNVHTMDDYLVISYYTDGCVIVDAKRPDNLIQVAQYDTYPDNFVGFNGAWGAYPYLPSGNILVSDINYGLFVLNAQLERACYLEGNITDANTNLGIPQVNVEILGDELNQEVSRLNGNYQTGLAIAGNYQVRFTKSGYQPLEVTVDLSNGLVTELDVEMIPLPTYSISGRVIDQISGLGIAEVPVVMEAEDLRYWTLTDEQGNFGFLEVFEGKYDLISARWGFKYGWQEVVLQEEGQNLTLELEPGYEDWFNIDLGWEVASTATEGLWERGQPKGTLAPTGEISNPYADSEQDPGNYCYVTGNKGVEVYFDEVQNGATYLLSPSMDLSTYNQPIIQFQTWFFNRRPGNNPNDSLWVYIENGVDTFLLHTDTIPASEWSATYSIPLKGQIVLNDQMRLIVKTEDQSTSTHLLEGGFDFFSVSEGRPDESFTVRNAIGKLLAYPNPFAEELNLDYVLAEDETGELQIINSLGQEIYTAPLSVPKGSLTIITSNWAAGIYWVRLRTKDKTGQFVKIVKTGT